ncbi:hypothetical protein JCM8097_006694 [Rhodosporidiobolus ruineniae]
METDAQLPAASTSAATLDVLEDSGEATQPTEAGRAKRSRRDRPCDLCRIKHQCIIPVRGEPCKACQSRSKPCTFEAPPVIRIRKPKPVDGTEDEPLAPDQRNRQRDEDTASRGVRSESELRSSSSSATSTSLLSLIQLGKLPAQSPPLPTPSSFPEVPLSTADGRADPLHYISTSAFSDLTFSVEDSHTGRYPGDPSFRQVSNDPANSVFFVSTPALMYGTVLPANGQRLWEAVCGILSAEAPKQLVELYMRQTQPAFPILDEGQFRNPDPAVLASSGVSYGLLASLLAHSTCYIAAIRPHHRALWRNALLSLEDEYRKPSLQTISLALVTLNSRPAINVGQNTIAMGRLIGAAQLLGLHLDPSQWRIPRAERSVRKRLWWAVLISDKWRCALFGRPSNLSVQDSDVPLPTLDDADSDQPLLSSQTLSFQSFIAMCKLTLVLDSLLSSFFTVRALRSPGSPAERLQKLEVVGIELVALEQSLPQELLDLPDEFNTSAPAAPTGVRSFQLCKIGVSLIIYRLTASCFIRPSSAQKVALFQTALNLVQGLVEFLERLSLEDFGSFWSPYASFIISNAGALLLRVAINAKVVDQTIRTTCGVLFTRLVVTLTSSHHAAKWDVASLALDRVATLLRSLDGQLPELVPLLCLFGQPNHAAEASGPPPPNSSIAQQPTLSPNRPAQPLPSPSFAAPAPPRSFSPHTSTSTAPLPFSPFLPPPAAAAQRQPSMGWTAAAPPPPPPLPPHPASTSSTAPIEQPFSWTSPASANEAPDGFWWMNTEILQVPEHYEDLPDIFEGWGEVAMEGTGGEGGGGAANGAGLGAAGEGGAFDLLRFLQGPAGGADGSGGAGV